MKSRIKCCNAFLEVPYLPDGLFRLQKRLCRFFLFLFYVGQVCWLGTYGGFWRDVSCCWSLRAGASRDAWKETTADD